MQLLRSLFLILCSFVYLGALAQNAPEYLIYSSEGRVDAIHFKRAYPAQAGKILYSKDLLLIKDAQSQIMLSDAHGHWLLLNSKGEYNIERLHEMPFQDTSRIFEEFLKELWISYAITEKDGTDQTVHSLEKIWNISTGHADCHLGIFPNRGMVFDSDSITFRWENADPSKIYRFSILNQNQHLAIAFLVRDTQIVLISRCLPYGAYYWSVNSTHRPCKTPNLSPFAIVSKSEWNLVTSILIQGVPLEHNLIDYYLNVSDVLGQEGYFQEALKYFDKCLELYRKESKL